MTELFKHTPVPHNSATSPVENLANEVQAGFNSLEQYLLHPNTPIPNIGKVIGAFLLKEVKKHGTITTLTESFSIDLQQQSVVLSAVPTDSITVKYFDSIKNKDIHLERKNANQIFTDKFQFKTIGKNLYFSGNLSNTSLEVTYTGLVPSLAGSQVLSNVISNTSGEYLIDLEDVEANKKFKLNYDFNVQKSIPSIFKDSKVNHSNVYFFGENNGEYEVIPYITFTIASNTITVYSEADTVDYTKAFVYVLNSSISDLLTSIYLDYIEHSHTPLGATPAISHTSLIDNYKDSDKIVYKDSQVPNYSHPQFLNREGFNPNLDEVYSNAMLGDLFLSALINEQDQKYKSLTKNSNSILFGDPVAGSKIYYDASNKIVSLHAGTTLNGLNVSFSPLNKGITLNNTSSISESEETMTISGKNGVVDVLAFEDKESEVRSDNLTVRNTIDTEAIKAKQIGIGSFILSESGDDVSVTSEKDATIFVSNMKVNSLEASNFQSLYYTLRNQDVIAIDENTYLKNNDGSFEFNSDKSVNFVSGGIDTGTSIGTKQYGKSKTYFSNSSGSISPNGNDLYTTLPLSSTHYHLIDTDTTVTFEGVSYKFNKNEPGFKNITNLREWFKSDLVAGKITGYSLNLSSSDLENKNGLRIGTSAISVTSNKGDCPEGLTILESKSDFHFIADRTLEAPSCANLAYQAVNTGNLQVFGDLSTDGEGLFLGGLTTSADISGKNLNIAEDIQASNVNASSSVSTRRLEVQETLTVTGNTTLGSSLEVKGDISSNSIEVKDSVSVVNNTTLGKNLTVGGDTFINGRLSIAQGFQTTGDISSESITTGDIDAKHLDVTNGITGTGDFKLTGNTDIGGTLNVGGNQAIGGSLEVSQDVTMKTAYIMDSTTIDGRLFCRGNVELSGESITIGSPSSLLTLKGELQLNNNLTTFTGSASILGSLEVFNKTILGDDLRVKGSTQTTSLEVASSAKVNGSFQADSGEFARKLVLVDGLKATGISEFTSATIDKLTAETISTTDMYIKSNLDMGADSIIKTSTIEVSKVIQNNPAEASSFVGAISFSNEVAISNTLVIGNRDIMSTRDTSGVFITDSQIKMGNNSLINAVKIFAGKGAPRDGNVDRTGGFCFQSPTSIGTSDGDTGMFATIGSGAGTENSDLQFYIDGTKKGEFQSSPFELPNYDDTTVQDPLKAKVIITYDVLLQFKKQLKDAVSEGFKLATDKAWPIGSMYTNTRDTRNPSHTDLLGIGVWIPYGAGRTVVGLASSDVGGGISGGLTPPANMRVTALRSESGNYTHVLKPGELPKGDLRLKLTTWVHGDDASGSGAILTANRKWASGTQYPEGATVNTGGQDLPHNIVQPSIIAAQWERIA